MGIVLRAHRKATVPQINECIKYILLQLHKTVPGILDF